MVGEEQYGWQTVMEVEDDGGWNRFWVRDKNFFRGQGARGRIEPKDGSGFAVFGNWFHAATPAIEGGERSWIWAAVSISSLGMFRSSRNKISETFGRLHSSIGSV
jgi:hypothetical protein